MLETLINYLTQNHIPFTWLDGALVFTTDNRAYAITPTSDNSIIVVRGTLGGQK